MNLRRDADKDSNRSTSLHHCRSGTRCSGQETFEPLACMKCVQRCTASSKVDLLGHNGTPLLLAIR